MRLFDGRAMAFTIESMALRMLIFSGRKSPEGRLRAGIAFLSAPILRERV